ncbi:MAG: sugar ABC transporter permease [Clostridiales bacterium]|nr:sugar ABC transporter permease [Clostridiales bacterium]
MNAPLRARRGRRLRALSLTGKRKLAGYLFILPWIVGFSGFYAYNLVQAVRFSFSEMETLEAGGYLLHGVGLANFRYALTEMATYVRTLTESMGDMLMNLPLIIFFSLFMAILLNNRFAGRAAIRAIFFLPVIMASPAIVQALSQNLQNMMGGVSSAGSQLAADTIRENGTGLDTMALVMTLLDFGVPPRLLGYIVDAVGRMYDILRMSGVQIIIFLAALQSIPPALYEVAKIEGATAYETFWKITFPMVSPLLLTNVVYTMIDQFTQSEIVTLAHETAFRSLDFGVSAAMSIVNTLCVGAALVIVGGLVSRRVFYHE